MKAVKTTPFKLDPRTRQRFTLVGASKTFPVTDRDVEAIDAFVKDFTESLRAWKKPAHLAAKPQVDRKAATRRLAGTLALGRPQASSLAVLPGKRRKKAARRRRVRLSSRLSRSA